MNLDASKIADNKLVVLYIFKIVNMSLSKNQLNNIVLENNLINFFTLQQCIGELEEAELIKKIDNSQKELYTITNNGINTLEIFVERISKSSKSTLDDYIVKNKENIRKEAQVTAEYSKHGNNEYIVNLKVTENDMILIDLKLSVVSAKQAKFICEKWKNSSQNVYKQIMNSIIN